ncbi:hypothetical protein TNIN_287561 [Trichonephila inaurata madagascariensis]|uniref:Uncharacterized protein n=1 Tax=Trichonephila inaurata madagascariensis TaxID=2747483 RepID=A0A8X6ILX0_9ARAC|nr:hypothetical protein TNIN_287561 [Trichonephila inaurata madagascariensis]
MGFIKNSILTQASTEDDFIDQIIRRYTGSATHLTSIPGPMGLTHSKEEKLNLLGDQLESSFTENAEPQDEDFIDIEERSTQS